MVPVEAINKERLTRWRNQCNRKHATPIVLISVGHDHNNAEVTIFTTEDRTDEELLMFLEHAVKALKEKMAAKN